MAVKEMQVKLDNDEITVYDVGHDVNGNPRFVVHFLSLGVELKDYGRIPGLKKYRAKWFGGGYVFQSYNVEKDLEWMIDHVKKYYENQK